MSMVVTTTRKTGPFPGTDGPGGYGVRHPPNSPNTKEIKLPTCLGDSLLKDLTLGIGGSVTLIKTCTNCIFITVAFSPIIYFTVQTILSKWYPKFQPTGSYNLGSHL